jgi:PhzF family phenazine biosynthesis protein
MKLRLHHVDAFADRRFSGNPAAVMVFRDYPDNAFLQAVAAENNLAETAYVVPMAERGAYRLRWFTPATEVPLCGHATLAAAWVLWNRYEETDPTIRFATQSGELRVARREANLVELDLPARNPVPVSGERVGRALGATPLTVLDSGATYVAVFETEAQVRALCPDFRAVAALERHAVFVTAAADGADTDFVQRCFAPHVGIDEDPVTGSSQCDLTPYWTARLGKKHLVARQLSARGGTLRSYVDADRVHVVGSVIPYLDGEIDGP